MNKVDAIRIVKDAVTAEDAARALGLNVDRRGRALCPWHSERHPSLHLYKGDRGCWCFACQNGGSVIDLTMQVLGCDTWDAVRWLSDTFALGLTLDGKPDMAVSTEITRRRQRADELHEKLVDIQDAINECDILLGDLNDQIRQYRPKRMTDEWNKQFCKAVKAYEDAKVIESDLYAMRDETQKQLRDNSFWRNKDERSKPDRRGQAEDRVRA